ncbi:hypothetical protein BD410DRAFT_766038 [Rickenella mellea]|uniref:Cupin type-2 domain-containing protein n=1 Tax=Rickenella mellea TaxID=50990 RepID=A0A4Y7QCL4_9AGAM|nr:hypothetical protein BD410DRAFT_766038 [Rickenella mellea]
MTPSVPLPPPAIRRVITGHTPAGKATVVEDKVTTMQKFGDKPDAALFTTLYRSDDLKPSNDGEYVESTKQDLIGEEGSTFRAWDMAPHSISPFHRTISLDYAIVVKGSIVCELDDGKRVSLSAGDVLVQRGTIHAWHNETDEWTRVFFTMIASKPVEIDGKKLPTEFKESSK